MARHPRRTLVLGLLAGAALLVAVYAAAGYSLAPRYLERALHAQADAAGLRLAWRALSVNPWRPSATLEHAELRNPEGQVVATADALLANLAWASLWRSEWILDELALQAPQATIALGAGGSTNWPALNIGSGGAPRVFLLRHLAVRDGNLVLQDASLGKGTEFALANINLDARGLTNERGNPGKYEFSAKMPDGGSLASQGALSNLGAEAKGDVRVTYPSGQSKEGPAGLEGQWLWSGQRAELRVQAHGMDLRPLRPWLPKDIGLDSGTVSGDGTLRWSAKDGPAFAGKLTLADVKVMQRDTKELLLGWRRLEVPSLEVHRDGARAAEITADGAQARLVLDAEGRLNFAQAFAGRGGGARYRIAVDRVVLENSSLAFEDRSVQGPFEVTVHELAGAIAGLDTSPGHAARVQLKGRVERYGVAQINGTLDFDSPKSLTDIRGRLRNLDVAKLTPYAAKFAGYELKSGRLSASLRYRVRDGRLQGDNRLEVDQLVLGDKVKDASVKDLPVELAIALLKDPQGRIDVAIPVRGDLSDPSFDTAELIRDAIGNALKKVAGAPFRAVASMLGGKQQDLRALRFDPGSVAVNPPMEEGLGQITRVLSARPALTLAIHGGYDPAADVRAMQRREARREVAERAGIKVESKDAAPLDYSDHALIRAAERLLAERGTTREEMAKLREANESGYGRALMERLATGIRVDEQTAAKLAQARAYVVQAALAVRGIDAERVEISSTDRVRADAAGVPTKIEVGSGRLDAEMALQ